MEVGQGPNVGCSAKGKKKDTAIVGNNKESSVHNDIPSAS
jgi:hypothetical protein